PAPEPAPEPAPQPAPAQQPAPQPAPAPAPQPEPAPAAQQPAARPAPTAPVADGTYVTPLVPRLAAEHGVDLSTVKGSGVGGRIRKQDVLAAAEAARAAAVEAQPAAASRPAAPAPSPLRGQTVKMSRIRRVIAENMMKALH